MTEEDHPQAHEPPDLTSLSSALNQMAHRLQTMIEKEKDSRNRLQQRVTKLLELTDEVVGPEPEPSGELDEIARLTRAVNKIVRNDILVRQDLERSRIQLEEANEKLKELEQLKMEFLNTVSHELRTPLTSIKAFAEILLDTKDEDPETQMEFLGIINQEADRLTRLVNNILDISRIEAGAMNWRFQDCDLNKLVREAWDTLHASAEKKQVEYLLEMCSEALPVKADEDKMVQVLTSLLGNALKFTSTGGRVCIHTRRDGRVGEIIVSDSGIGIAPEHHQGIFEKFGQVDTSDTRDIKGSGLGLPIARSVVEAHEGKLTVDSQLGQGARFCVRLPLEI